MKLEFIKDNKKQLGPSEVDYWVRVLNDCLKTGLEFEFNLNYREFMCRTLNPKCKCIKRPNCRKLCLFEDKCQLFLEGLCDSKSCPNYISKCKSCEEFDPGCDKCDRRYDIRYDPSGARAAIKNTLKPTNNWGLMGEHGVVEVTRDGSLRNGGVEITTVGRKTDYYKLSSLSEKVISTALKYGGFVNERTSIHIHLLTTYYREVKRKSEHGYGKIDVLELEKEIPSIIFANFWQLCRLYQNTLTWLSLGLPLENKRTRWEKFRVSILTLDPTFKSFRKFKSEILDYVAVFGKNDYGFVNPIHCTSMKKGLGVFHVELRVMDNIPVPQIVAAMSCLFQAILLKATKLSKYGSIFIPKNKVDKLLKIKEKILNHCPPDYNSGDFGRFSDTSNLPEVEEILRRESIDLLTFVKGELEYFGPDPFQILLDVAKEPISYRLRNGWEQIIEYFNKTYPIVKAGPEINEMELELKKFVDLRTTVNCKSLTQWINATYKTLSCEAEKRDYSRLVREKVRAGELEWSEAFGTVINRR